MKRLSVIGKIFFLILITVYGLQTTGCGFRPMYGENSETPVGVEDQLGQVELGNIPDREGQYLRNALIDRFYRDGRPSEPRYILNISDITEGLTDLDITKTADATRGQLRLSAGMTLIDVRAHELVLQRTLVSITSYNKLGSEFATRVTEENARRNALDDLARQVEMQAALYLKRQ